MASPGANPDHLGRNLVSPMLLRLTTTAVAPHGLMDRLTAKGLLTPADIAGIREFALDLARDLRDHGASGPQVAGARLEADVRAFFAAIAPDDGPGTGAERV